MGGWAPGPAGDLVKWRPGGVVGKDYGPWTGLVATEVWEGEARGPLGCIWTSQTKK